MHLVELFLPLFDDADARFPKRLYDTVRDELAEMFGGVTTFTRTPATGLWEDDGGQMRHDEIVLFEVMVEHVDHAWWRRYRGDLEGRFDQDEVLVRATAVERL